LSLNDANIEARIRADRDGYITLPGPSVPRLEKD